MKKLYRSTTDRQLGGVLGGLAEYTNTDSALIRILFILLVLATGIFPMVVAYLLALFLVPEQLSTGGRNVVDEQ